MRTLGLVADKLLAVVAPQLKASACCLGAGTKFTESCGCLRNGVGLQKTCTVTCTCGTTCGACSPIPNASCR